MYTKVTLALFKCAKQERTVQEESSEMVLTEHCLLADSQQMLLWFKTQLLNMGMQLQRLKFGPLHVHLFLVSLRIDKTSASVDLIANYRIC